MTKQRTPDEPETAGSFEHSQGLPAALSYWLIRHSARKAPLDLADRLAEEWQADCGARPSPLSQLRFALGCCWATRVIAHEYGPAMIPVVAVVRSSSLLVGHSDHESGMTSRRSSLFFLAAGLHIALFYCLMTGLAFCMVAAMPSSMHHPVSQTAPDHVLPPQLMTAQIEFPSPHFATLKDAVAKRDTLSQQPRE